MSQLSQSTNQPDPPEQQIEKAKTAVVHVIERIRADHNVRYYLGYGTESFDLLAEAAASLCNEPVDKVRVYAAGLDLPLRK